MNSTVPQKHKILDKRIPTILGVGLLVVGIIVGTIVFSRGTGVFAPRAAPETTPKNVKISNVTDKSFSVSFATDEPTIGYVKYGTDPKNLKTQIGDDRDQLYGTVSSYPLHHITVSGLEERIPYYFVIGTGSQTMFDNNGQPFAVTTAAKGGPMPEARTIYGAVTDVQSTPAEGSIVYVTIDGAGIMSQLVQKTGSWAIPLSNARSTDGSTYASFSDDTPMLLLAQGHPLSLTGTQDTTVGSYVNGSSLVLGQSGQGKGTSPSPTPLDIPDLPHSPGSTETGELSPTPSVSPTTAAKSDGNALLSPPPSKADSSRSGMLSELLGSDGSGNATESGSVPDEIIDLTKQGTEAIRDSSPLIKGKAAPNVVVVVKVNSDSQIEQRVQADANGDFALDIEALSQDLEPGEHTVEYTYIDPTTGEEVTSTYTFTVAPKSQQAQLAQANYSPTPRPATGSGSTPSPTPATYGTDYPYGVSPTPGASGSGNLTHTPTPTTGVSTPGAQVTNSGTLTQAGSTGTTIALLIGGFLFMLAGSWSFWVAKELGKDS